MAARIADIRRLLFFIIQQNRWVGSQMVLASGMSSLLWGIEFEVSNCYWLQIH